MQNQKGQIIIIASVFMFIVITLVTALVSYAGVQIKSHRQAVGRVQGLNIAEAGIEKAVWKLNNELNYTGETGTVFGNGTYNVTVTTINGTTKLVRADAFIPNSANPRAKRTVQVTVSLGASGFGFNYGIQVGEGGLEMDNNSTVTGNIYANGSIVGSAGTSVTGTAVSAGGDGRIEDMSMGGDAHAHFLENVTVAGNTTSASLIQGTVGGSAVSDTISGCTIGGNATYDTKTSCTIGGSETSPNPVNYVDPSDEDFPIPEEIIDGWEAEAEAGGIISSQTIEGTSTLGPKKINGNLTLNNGAILTVTGTLWVTGTITINNNSTVKLDTSYGNLSGVIMAGQDGDSSNGTINAQNGSIILGSGTTGSYLMLL
jgi:hypothetical protein